MVSSALAGLACHRQATTSRKKKNCLQRNLSSQAIEHSKYNPNPKLMGVFLKGREEACVRCFDL